MRKYDGYSVVTEEEWNALIEKQNMDAGEVNADNKKKSAKAPTPSQQAVIDIRDTNLLVSAAAGSGKTWVLVERIMGKIINDRIPIDRFLIVTFTNAAAAEMRERIAKAIEKKYRELCIKKQSGEEVLEELITFLREQIANVNNAQISTIDSFCKSIVQEYFMNIDIDPNYRIAEKGEFSSLREDALNKVLEECYERSINESDSEFAHRFNSLAKSYITGKDDGHFRELVLKVYDYQASTPDSDKYFEDCRRYIREDDLWFNEIIKHVTYLMHDVRNIMLYALELARSDDEVIGFEGVLECDIELADEILEIVENNKLSAMRRFDDLYEYFSQFGGKKIFKNMPRSTKWLDQKLVQKVKNNRDYYKDIINKKIIDEYFLMPSKQWIKEKNLCIDLTETLIDVAVRFRDTYDESKLKNRLLEFSDIEHLALKILTVKNENGEFEPSSVATELKNYYHEIMIDEYQDSNYLQEAILSSFADNNMFMVGDMKQSIYRFRNAEPELFVGKHNDYELVTNDSETVSGDVNKNVGKLVELDQNFRSSSNVLNSINYIFDYIMKRDVGDVEYDTDAALKPGADFRNPVFKENSKEFLENDESAFCYDNRFEMMLYDVTSADEEDSEEETSSDKNAKKDDDSEDLFADHDALTKEAYMVASRIKELVSSEKRYLVKDLDESEDDNDCYRPCEYRDIVILMRSPKGKADVFNNVLNEQGIPTVMESSEGYFSTMEIRQVLSYLTAVDNPDDDIAFTASLKNYFGGLNTNELVIFKALPAEESDTGFNVTMYDRVSGFIKNFGDIIANLAEEGKIGLDRLEACELAEALTAKNTDEIITVPNKFKGQAVYLGVDLGVLYLKLKYFFGCFEHFRSISNENPVSEMLTELYTLTNFYDYVTAMPAGEKRRGNLDMLVAKARAYEATDYRGLSQFVAYINQMKRYEVDYGEASTLSPEDNVVRIMSIHKSKGLEFPVVFVSTANKKFNDSDSKDNILFTSKYGIALDYINPEKRTRKKTIMKQVSALDIMRSCRGEELRVLYVALTRAKDKCIVTGTLDKEFGKVLSGIREPGYSEIIAKNNYLAWILLALKKHEAIKEFLDYSDLIHEDGENKSGSRLRNPSKSVYADADISVKLITEGDINVTKNDEAISTEAFFGHLIKEVSAVKNEDIKELRENLDIRYKHINATKTSAKMSVSKVKKAAMKENDEIPDGGVIYPELDVMIEENMVERHIDSQKQESVLENGKASECASEVLLKDFKPTIPEFMKFRVQSSGHMSGSEKGTMIHKAMELYDFRLGYDEKEYNRVIEELKDYGYINPEKYFRIKDLQCFIESDLGDICVEASKNGNLYKEAQFITAFGADEIMEVFKEDTSGLEDEDILIQGIIDGYIENDDDIIVFDYKTDNLKNDIAFVDHYKKQLELYADALSRGLGKPVSRMIIYSFKFGRSIEM